MTTRIAGRRIGARPGGSTSSLPPPSGSDTNSLPLGERRVVGDWQPRARPVIEQALGSLIAAAIVAIVAAVVTGYLRKPAVAGAVEFIGFLFIGVGWWFLMNAFAQHQRLREETIRWAGSGDRWLPLEGPKVTVDRWRAAGTDVGNDDDPSLLAELEDVRTWQQALTDRIRSGTSYGLRYLSEGLVCVIFAELWLKPTEPRRWLLLLFPLVWSIKIPLIELTIWYRMLTTRGRKRALQSS